MTLDFMFVFTNIALGVGLAMDAFSVAMANGIRESEMKLGKMCGVAGIFAFFQALMPLLGWLCIHTVVQYFESFTVLIPWIALALLGYIGGKMLYEGIKSSSCPVVPAAIGVGALLVQGVATSIDALSAGFTIAEYDLPAALLASAIIAAVTVVICYAGVIIGKTVGNKIAGKANILGGVILILIGIEIFITGVF